MRDYWLTRELLQATSIAFGLASLAALGLALALPRKWWAKLLAVLAVGSLLALPVREAAEKRQQSRMMLAGQDQRYVHATALFEERCKTAGEKIYRTVANVESIELVNPRPEKRQGVDERDPHWAGAGLAGESTGNQYIMNFLFYDVPDDGRTLRTLDPGGAAGPRGSIAAGVAPKGGRGYRHVEVEADGARYRYQLRPTSSYAVESDPVAAYGQRSLATGARPRYAVAYENIVDPEGHANWIAGARLKVLDRQSGELLAEFVQFSFEAGFGSEAGSRQPWSFARHCPVPGDARPAGLTRFFSQKVLQPIQAE